MPSDVIIRMDKTSARCMLDALKTELKSQQKEIEKELKGIKHKRVRFQDCCVACNHAYEQTQKALKRAK
jgi:multidrug resistance efflux pump